MTVFVYQQEQIILEPLEYIAQAWTKNRWQDIGRRYRNYGDACSAIVRYQRKVKGNGKGRIVIQGVTSTQTWSIPNKKP